MAAAAAAADRNVGEGNAGAGQQEYHHHDHQQQKHRKGPISAVVDTVVNKALGFGGASEAEKRRSLGAA
ncbi:hypothetical protein LY76DRAFT_590325 [Colletotrichum caudatum]|nr:hypothetical protein LY76DRAFT_590325 [Colletotrichum caudatum]